MVVKHQTIYFFFFDLLELNLKAINIAKANIIMLIKIAILYLLPSSKFYHKNPVRLFIRRMNKGNTTPIYLKLGGNKN